MIRTVRSAALGAAAILVLAAAAPAAVPPSAARAAEPAPSSKAPAASKGGSAGPLTRKIKFTYQALYEPLPAAASMLDFWVPVPQDGRDQKVSIIIMQSLPGTFDNDPVYGDRMLHVARERMGLRQVQFTADFTVERREVRRADLWRGPTPPPAPPKSLERYLQPDRLAPLDEATKRLAGEVTKGKTTAEERARAIYDHIVKTMKLDRKAPGWGRGDLSRALRVKSGDCSDLNAVFIALARASGIPARQVTGFKVPKDVPKGFTEIHHCWAEFHLDGTGWVPVDCVEAVLEPSRRDYYFGSLDPDRIEFSIGRDVTLIPPQKGPPLDFLLYPYGEADGKPLGSGRYRFTWEEAREEPGPAS